MKVYILQKIDLISGGFSIVCVYADYQECLKFLKGAGWVMTNTPNMYNHVDMHSQLFIHERELIGFELDYNDY